MRKWAYAAAAGVAVVVAMTGCTAGSGGPSAGSSSAAPTTGTGSGGSASAGGSASPAPTDLASPTPAPTAAPTTTPTSKPSAGADPHGDHGTVPTTCKATMSAATYAKTFAGTPLNPAGYDLKKELGLIASSAQTSGRAIECLWRDPRADITNLDLVIAPVDPVKAAASLKALSGFTCVPLGEGTRCQKISTDPQYGVDLGDTYYIRGSTGVRISQANFPTNGFLNEVILHVW